MIQPEANHKGLSSSFSCSTRSPQFSLMCVFDSINFNFHQTENENFLPYGRDIKEQNGNFERRFSAISVDCGVNLYTVCCGG